MNAPRRLLERRGFLRAGAVVFATVASGGCMSLFVTKRDPDVKLAAVSGAVRVPMSSAAWLRGGEGSLAVEIEGRDDKVLLFREQGGRILAVSMTCKHLGCDVGYDPARGRIVCPCHGTEYANDGAVLKGPAKAPIAAFPVEVVGDDVVVSVGA